MVSAENLVERRIAELGRWLAEQGVDVRDERAHLDQGSRDRLFTARGATLH